VRELGDGRGEGFPLASLGSAYHHIGDHAQAITRYREAAAIYGDLGDRFHEANTLARLGDAHDAAGDRAAARTAWRQAVTILDELDHADAEQVRAKLAETH